MGITYPKDKIRGGSVEWVKRELAYYTENVENPRNKPWLRTALKSYLETDAKRHKFETRNIEPVLLWFFKEDK